MIMETRNPVLRVGRTGGVLGMVAATFSLTFSVTCARAMDIGDINLNARLRYETAEIDGLDDADAATLRLRLGYATPVWHGFKAMVEGEFTGVADKDSYNAAGVHGDPSKAVIADPESAELDQLYVMYSTNGVKAVLGRQRINLDNARFVGDVAWRQNRQTYDAATIRYTGVDKLNLYYGYVDNVVRIFGSEAPSTGSNASEAGSESHLVNASYLHSDQFKLTLYAYLLDLDDIPPTSSVDSIGGSATGRVPIEEFDLGYRAEYAYQEDAGRNPLDYQADYIHLNADGAYKGILADIGYEILGADNTGAVDDDGNPVFASFQTPLATLHKFNGFADRFLVTPDKGLEDFYISLGYKLPVTDQVGPVLAKIIYHDFSSSKGSDDLGSEWDALAVMPINTESVPGTFKVLAKYASYSKGDVGADTDRFTIELNYEVTF